MKINLPIIKNIMPSIRGLNFWTLTQKIKDHTIQKTSTIQLLQKIDIYKFVNSSDLDWLRLLSFMPTPNLNIRFQSNQQKGINFLKNNAELKRTTGYMKSHSFTLQFQQIFIEYPSARVYQPSTTTGFNTNAICTTTAIRDVTNTVRQLYSNLTTQGTNYANGMAPCLNAPTTITTYGILAGTGVTAPATLDYTMQTLIAHGIAAGNLLYQATAVGGAGVVGANTDTIIARVLVNGSGGTVTIKEVGMAVALNAYGDTTTAHYFLVAHDAVNQAIANGEVAIVSYDFRTTV